MDSDAQKTQAIRAEIISIGRSIKERYPFLRHRNVIGISFFLSSIVMILGMMILYVNGYVSALAAVLWIAFWTSILHELEHDLIHYMYFKKNLFLHNIMLLGVWLFRPLTINPWYRRLLHFHHHKYSGTQSDIEERGVTNGMKWGVFRLLVMPDLLLANTANISAMRKAIRQSYKDGRLSKSELINLRKALVFGFLPFGIPLYMMWYSFILLQVFSYIITNYMELLSVSTIWIENYLALIHPIIVLIILPNLLRQYCLHFITSNMHYYGDVEGGNIYQQTQVLNAWWTWPFQLFCFNFGSTHSIHHFVVDEPFYFRQLTAPAAHLVFRKYAVRFNDLGTFARANRYSEDALV